MKNLQNALARENEQRQTITSLGDLLGDWRPMRAPEPFSWVVAVWIALFGLSAGLAYGAQAWGLVLGFVR